MNRLGRTDSPFELDPSRSKSQDAAMFRGTGLLHLVVIEGGGSEQDLAHLYVLSLDPSLLEGIALVPKRRSTWSLGRSWPDQYSDAIVGREPLGSWLQQRVRWIRSGNFTGAL